MSSPTPWSHAGPDTILPLCVITLVVGLKSMAFQSTLNLFKVNMTSYYIPDLETMNLITGKFDCCVETVIRGMIF